MIKWTMSIIIVLFVFLGIAAVDAQAHATLPQFKSGASVMMGVPVDFKILDQRVSAIYDVVESDESHIVWKFTGSTGDWAFVFADGRIVVASTIDFDFAAYDTLTNELRDVMDMLNIVNAKITDEAKNNALWSAVYYASEQGIYHKIKYDFNSNFDFTLVVPDCTVKKARLTVSGNDVNGQAYSIDGIEVVSCHTTYVGQDCGVPPTEITDKIPAGLHSISASSIQWEHTMWIETITSPMPPKKFTLYGPDYQPWINETGESLTLKELYEIIDVQQPILNKTNLSNENQSSSILVSDPSAFPKVKVNIFFNTSCAKSGGLMQNDFKIHEDDKGVAIDGFYFSGNASGQKLDLAIVFDETTSMEEEINDLKLKVKDLTQKIKSSKLDARYSLVTFNGADVATKINWTNDADSFGNIIGKISVSGGNPDLPENSLDGMERALSFGFRSDAQKAIIVVTDEPSQQKGDGESNSAYTIEDVKSDLLNSGAMLIAVSPDFRNPNVDPNVPRSSLPKYADMRVLAKETSSLWIDMNSADFSAIMEQFKGIITGTYVLEYTSPNLTPNTNRNITVTVNNSLCDGAVGSVTVNYVSPM
jgi:hypothetical protein